ncbi:MAG: aspartate-semialdehyde dehydrogenase [Gammaproteobacteria bacterium]
MYLKVEFICLRGFVGYVLLDRLLQEKDFRDVAITFFSTSQVGTNAPLNFAATPYVQDAMDLKLLSSFDIILSCQGGDYSKNTLINLRNQSWDGFWIDAASTFRMSNDSVIVLDPINKQMIEDGLHSGIKNYIGGNCTVTLMLMAIGNLFKYDLIEWVTSMTYQAASGAGAKQMLELVKQFSALSDSCRELIHQPTISSLTIDKQISKTLASADFPNELFKAPLAASLIPWIDSAVENGHTREEWKGMVETNKILQTNEMIPIDGLCVRIAAMRCHSQALTIKLKKNISTQEIEAILAESNPWVKVIPNNQEATLKELTPAAISGTLNIAVGRIKKLTLGEQYCAVFTVGDQLLWGAAEPLRRVLRMIVDFKNK